MKNINQTSKCLGLFSLTVASLFFSACGSDTPTNDGLGAPAVEPPLTASLPLGLKVTEGQALRISRKSPLALSTNPLQQCSEGGQPTSGGLTDENLLAATVYCRIFGKGPIQIKSVTQSVDNRLVDFDNRILESGESPACLDAALVDKSTTFIFPFETANFTQKYQCKDELSDVAVTALGKEASGDEDTWYVYDGQNDPKTAATATEGSTSGMSQAWKVTTDSNGDVLTEEGYITLAPQLMSCGTNTSGPCQSLSATDTMIAGSSMLMHVLVDTTAGTVEATAAGTGIGFCAFHIKTSDTVIYLKGQTGSCTTTEEVCLNADTFEVLSDLSACASLSGTNLALKTIDMSEYSSGDGGPTTAIPASSLGSNTKTEMGTWINYCPGPSEFADVDSLF
jgi:hypothetical protein